MPRVSVLVLVLKVLGLGLGLETSLFCVVFIFKFMEKSNIKETKSYQKHHNNVMLAWAHSVITHTRENIFTPCHFSSSLGNL